MKPETTDSTDDELILEALRTYTMRSSFQLSEMTGLGSGRLYSAIVRLERAGKVTSEWEDMSPPRRRRYRLAEDINEPTI